MTETERHYPEHSQHEHHGHGNEHDQGLEAMLRYAKNAQRMWTSEVNVAVVDALALQGGEHLADIGAGVGAGASVAATQAGQVFAVEPTPYMRRILSARSRLSRKPFAVVNGSAEATTLPDDSMHAIMAVNTMHHWVDMEAACAELARILRPGGRMLLVDENFEDPTHPDHGMWTERHGGADGHGHHFHMVDTEQIAATFDVAGLTISSHGDRRVAGRPSWVVEVA